MPSWFHALHVQHPPPGTFCFCDIEWKCITDHGDEWLVARVASDREKDFELGEAGRGGAQLNCKGRSGGKLGVNRDNLYACYKGVRAKRTPAKLANSQGVDNKENTAKAGPSCRRGKISRCQSVKCGCTFQYRVKGYEGLGDIALKFKPGSQNHLDKDGKAPHVGVSNRPLSEAARCFVRDRLLLRLVPKLILEGKLQPYPTICAN